MARIKFTSARVFFLLLIISNEVLLSEGRHLKQKKKGKECRKCQMHDKKGDGHELSGGMQHYHASTVMDVDNFRPTAPGHSPGIGHSFVENYHASADIDVDNFRPTAPGHSPGIGHSQVEHYHTILFSEGRHLKAEKRNELMHANRSASVTTKGGAPSTKAINEGKNERDYEVNGQLTSPGHSPGIGHMLKNNMH